MRKFQVRDYQLSRITNIEENWAQYFRQLLEMATGTGKTSVAAEIFRREVGMGHRVLFLANRDKLVRQSAKRIHDEIGVECDIEMAGETASPYAQVVVASVPTLSRIGRLTSFAPDHFSLIVADESHHAGAVSWLRILNYFHFGAESLQDGWVAPVRGTYQPKCRILGITATPHPELGEVFDRFVEPAYTLINAVDDGWLVPIISKSVPLKIDIRALRAGRTVNGSDFKPEEISAKLIPVIDALAAQIKLLASDRKTIAFTPSVDCARRLAEAVTNLGMRGIFVSGECLDVDEKTQAYVDAGPGTVLCNCALFCEGADFPDTSCVLIARATKSKPFYRQMCGRGTRVLKGVVDGLETPEERRAAIAASAKPDLLILDPLWIHEKIDLCEIVDLYTDKPGARERLRAGADPIKAAKEAERDFYAALAKEARKHDRKQPRTINPLSWAVSVGDDVIANYIPETDADAKPASREELDVLLKNGLDSSQIKTSGQAQKLIHRLRERDRMGLASPKQVQQLTLRFHWPEDKAVLFTKGKAGLHIAKQIEYKRYNQTAPKSVAPLVEDWS